MIVDPSDPADREAQRAVEWWQDQHVEPMLNVYGAVWELAPDLAIGEDLALRAVSLRPKRFQTIIEKLTREPGDLASMADIGGVRAVVGSQDDVDELHRVIANRLDVRRVRDWARNPRPTGYRAVPVHIREGGRTIEVQLRMFGQDAWANAVEQEMLLSGANYKAGEGEEAVIEFFKRVADLFAAIDLGESHPGLAPRLHEAFVI